MDGSENMFLPISHSMASYSEKVTCNVLCDCWVNVTFDHALIGILSFLFFVIENGIITAHQKT